jgi:hypothetical protein
VKEIRKTYADVRLIELVLSLHDLCSVGVLHLQQLSCQLVDHRHLGGCGIHLVVKAVETVLHDGQLLHVIRHHDGRQELLLQVTQTTKMFNTFKKKKKEKDRQNTIVIKNFSCKSQRRQNVNNLQVCKDRGGLAIVVGKVQPYISFYRSALGIPNSITEN